MLLRAALLILPLALVVDGQTDVLMNRYGPLSQGADVQEHVLNTANVRPQTFGKLFSYYVDGAVYAQPLFVHGVVTAGGVRDVLYVATMNDKVYAFDATKVGSPLWLRDFSDEQAGVTPVPVSDITNSNDLNIVGNAGIEGTPVIDLGTQSIFLVARTKENGRYVQRLHKLDLRDGKDQAVAVEIEAREAGSALDARDGFVYFDPRAGNQRAALALANDNVVIAWASHEDLRPYHGWIMAYDEATLKQVGALCLTPDTADGGVWQSGRGPAVDAHGDLFFEVGNGGWDGKRNFGNSVIKVRVTNEGLRVVDFYTPHDYAHQNKTDADLGSTGPMLIPPLAWQPSGSGSTQKRNRQASAQAVSGGSPKDLLVTGNKQGQVVLFQADHLGGLTPDDGGVKQAVDLKSGRVLAGPAYSGGDLFIWNEAGVPERLHFDGALLEPEPAARGTVPAHGSPGGSVTFSSDGGKAGSDILWATVSKKSADHGNAGGVFYAFSADTLEELWNSEDEPKRDRMGTLVKFVPPLIVGGKAYIPNYDNAVNVYGLLP